MILFLENNPRTTTCLKTLLIRFLLLFFPIRNGIGACSYFVVVDRVNHLLQSIHSGGGCLPNDLVAGEEVLAGSISYR